MNMNIDLDLDIDIDETFLTVKEDLILENILSDLFLLAKLHLLNLRDPDLILAYSLFPLLFQMPLLTGFI